MLRKTATKLYSCTQRISISADINASNIKVTEEEIQGSIRQYIENPELVQVIRRSLKNIKEYHEKQKQYSMV